MGTAVYLGRGQGGDRFYDAARARRGHHHGLPKSRWTAAAAQENATEEPSPSPAPSPGVAGNLERFVAAVTPSVRAQYPPKVRLLTPPIRDSVLFLNRWWIWDAESVEEVEGLRHGWRAGEAVLRSWRLMGGVQGMERIWCRCPAHA